MDLSQIRELLNIISASDVAEFEIREEGLEIVVRKASGGAGPAASVAAPASAVTTQPGVPATIETVAAPANETIIRSPIVGTFYRAPSPDSQPFVQVGDVVTIGQPLCVIEAMKLMNEVESEVSGTIRRILIENAEAVEYDQPLFVVERT